MDNILVPQEGQPLFRSHTCLHLMFEFGRVLCPARGYLGLQVQRFCVHSAWSLRSDGREHGGRGFRAGRTGLSAARMAKFRGIGTGEYHMRGPTTSKLLRKALRFAAPMARLADPSFLALLSTQRVAHETHRKEVAYDVILPWFGGSSLAEAVQGSTAASTLPHDRLALVDGSCTLLSACTWRLRIVDRRTAEVVWGADWADPDLSAPRRKSACREGA